VFGLFNKSSHVKSLPAFSEYEFLNETAQHEQLNSRLEPPTRIVDIEEELNDYLDKRLKAEKRKAIRWSDRRILQETAALF